MKVSPEIEPHRIADAHRGVGGMFEIEMNNLVFRILATEGADWDHVSVSTKRRTPNWAEMCKVKDWFFESEEAVMQLHVAKSEHISYHNFCLHLWRPHLEAIPLPYSALVAPRDDDQVRLYKEHAALIATEIPISSWWRVLLHPKLSWAILYKLTKFRDVDDIVKLAKMARRVLTGGARRANGNVAEQLRQETGFEWPSPPPRK